ncbi:MAG: DDE-type integrase/transposase/recombinase [Conexivisphaerales archaeon]
MVAVDETKIKVNGIHLFVCNAIDVKTKELIAYRVSRTRSIIDALTLLRAMLSCCSNKPLVLVDKGPWYPYALERLGIEYKHSTFGKRDAIERFYRTLKKRTKLFCNNINARRQGIKALESFVALFCFWYNFCRYHQSIGGEPVNVKLG